MSWCTVQEVKDTLNWPVTGAPVSDAVLLTFIAYAQEEVELVMKTKFGNVEDSGTASAGGAATLTDATKTWTVNAYANMVVWVTGGTGAGQYRSILSNTATALTVTPAWTTPPAVASTYKILTLGYIEETIDGTTTDTMFVNYQPLVSLISLVIDSVVVTPSYVYQYPAPGKLVMSSQAEAQFFKRNKPQLVSLKYVYGVYPMPLIIKRLCILMAALRALATQANGSYNSFISVQLPAGLSANRPELYIVIRSLMENMQNEARGIVFGTDPNFYSGYRPWVLFG